MISYIALLRGINVSGQKKVPMAELRAVLRACAFKNVQTYIQSGNVVFESSEKDTSILELKIFSSIKKQFGFEVPVLVKTNLEMKAIFRACPFLEKRKVSSYFTLLNTAPEKELIDSLNTVAFDDEEIVATRNVVYFFQKMDTVRQSVTLIL
ncbi:DUF1697 domain-containing protein [Lacinutrix neustonica]|uniref:DUF1697 domain-containing protein n=1 Tax=Lacinutrix neustonica TaxID=2980107 RepID=A0A9E8MWA8_9FLAO|nr:DUF1697 domain-containing protein [Lacinutrix neustonica]WAC01470.1 DUF1697 domain-containing protein [Lacinutrix neustonica]